MAALALLPQLPAVAVQNVMISWNPSTVPGVAGYKIYSGGESGVYTNVIDAGASTNITINGLLDGSTNYFSATTYDASGRESTHSSDVMFVAPTPSPVIDTGSNSNQVTTVVIPPTTNLPSILNVVSNLTVIANPTNANAVIVSWNASLDPTLAGYKIYYGSSSGNYTNVLDAHMATNVTISGLANRTTYYFAATEYDAAANESDYYSYESTYAVPASLPPVLSVVSNLTIVVTATNPSTVSLSWKAGKDATLAGYTVYIGNASGSYTRVIDAGLKTNAVIAGLYYGSTNYFAVTEHDASANQSPYYSSELKYVVPVLNLVSNVTVVASSTNASNVTVTWKAGKDGTLAGYKVYIGNASGVYNRIIDAGVKTNLVLTGLGYGLTNYFAVTEYDKAGNQSPYYSTEARYFVPVLNLVTNLTVTINPTNNASVIVKWYASKDSRVAGYKIYAGGTSQTYTNVFNAGAKTNLTILGLAYGATYYFAATAYDKATNETAYTSNEVKFYVPLPALNLVSNVTTTVNPTNVNSVVLSWKASKDFGMVGYKVLSGTASGRYTATQDVGTVTSLTFSDLVMGVTNFYAVQQYNWAGNVSSKSVEARWALNTPPTLNALPNLNLNINPGWQTVNMSGITSGSKSEKQTLKVSVTSSNPGLISSTILTYNSPGTTGSLIFRPLNNQTGTTVITVTVNDGGVNNNTVTQSFTVSVVNQALLAAMPKISKQLTNSMALPGKPVSMSVAVTGQAPFQYQWKFNGTNLPGATASTLNISSVKAAQTGFYSVQVANSVGVTNSALAQLVVITNTTPTISAPVQANGQFAFQVTGVAGLQYVVEATADMVNWTPVQTNTVPFTYTETNASNFDQRFYRSYNLQ